MSSLNLIFESLFHKFLSEKTKNKSEKVVVSIAIISFIIHLVLIGLVVLNLISPNDFSGLLKNPMVAIYTPEKSFGEIKFKSTNPIKTK